MSYAERAAFSSMPLPLLIHCFHAADADAYFIAAIFA